MLEIKVTILAPELANAIHSLADAINIASVTRVEEKAEAEKSTKSASKKKAASTTETDTAATASEIPAPATSQPVAPIPSAPPQVAPVMQPTMPQAPVVPLGAVPAQVPGYTQEQLIKACAQLADAGKRNELFNLLYAYQVRALTELRPEQYASFAAQLRALGAQI